MIAALVRDLRYAVRALGKSPGFTATAVATLALGIGANTAVFTAVDRVLLRPLPYPAPERLAMVARHFERRSTSSDQLSQNGRTWFALRDGVSSLDIAATSSTTGVNLMAQGQPIYVQQQRVTAGYFRVLGVAPEAGREFTPDEDHVNGPPAAILSHGLWRRAFGASSGVIGQSMTLRGEPYTIVGVMPASFRSDALVDVWTPLRPSTAGEGGGQNYTVIARLRSGNGWAEADGQVATVGADLLRSISLPDGLTIRYRLVPLQQGRASTLGQPLYILWAAVGVVLLIGCANVAGLLLARGAARAPEIATRMALGGGRLAIMRQMLAESVLLASGGAAIGVAVGHLTLQAFAAELESLFGAPVTIDLRILSITMVAAFATTVIFGLLPAIQLSRSDIRSLLTEFGGPNVAGSAHHRPRRLLVVAEVALSVVLIVGSGLLVRTLRHLTELEPGFDGSNVVTVTLSLQDARYETGERVNRLFGRTLDEIRQLPGVERAAIALTLPYERALNNSWRFVGGAPQEEVINLTYVTPEYFDALRIPLRNGRVFNDRDVGGSPHVVIVNRAFVQRYSRDREAVGRLLTLGTIVGVVGDIQQRAGWGTFGPVAVIPAAYVPATQVADAAFTLFHTWFSPSWIVRTSMPSPEIAQQLQRVIQRVDPQLPFKEFRTFDDVRAEAVAAQRVQATLLGTLSTLALILAAIGIYGLVASGVTERARELGIRMALGATSSQIVASAASPGAVLGVAGVAIGLLLARVSVSAMRTLVFGVPLTDVTTYVVAAAFVLIAAITAAVFPALRLLRLNLTTTLRRV